MSISSPPRPPRQSGESSRDRGRRSAGKRPDSGATGLIGRLYASAKAPFRLSDGKGRLRALLLAALFVFTLFGARLIDLQAIHATLALWSSGDHALTEGQMTRSEELVSGPWTYQRLERAGHWMQLDDPDAINDLLVEFLPT